MNKLISEGNYNNYFYEIWSTPDDDYPDYKYYFYKLIRKDLNNNSLQKSHSVIKSADNFETAQESKFAAIGHIDLLTLPDDK
jgi:hypothetical protein